VVKALITVESFDPSTLRRSLSWA